MSGAVWSPVSYTHLIWVVIVGAVYFVVYYFLFAFLIKKLDLKTPGRDDSEEVKLYRRSDLEARKAGGASDNSGAEDELSVRICQGLGGKKNISDVDCCATRLRCTVPVSYTHLGRLRSCQQQLGRCPLRRTGEINLLQ